MIKSQSPVLVLLDVMMPVMDGFDCLKAIREIDDFALLPIVMITGADDYDSISKSYLLGATDFIAKPINWTTLSHRLRYLLRASSALTLLAKSEAELRMAQKIAHLGSWEWVFSEEKVSCACQAIKVLSEEVFDGSFVDFFQSFTKSEAEKLSLALERCRVHKQSFQLQLIKHSELNSDRIYLIHGEPIVIDQTVTRILGTIQDITERQRIQEQIRFLSYYDQLTGLPNRVLFKEVIEQAIAFSSRNHTQLAALFIAIDRFKRINETLGPGIGDRVLNLFADRLVEQARQCPFIDIDAGYQLSDVNLFRPSGNEFTILLNKIHDTRDSIKVAKSIIDVMVLPFRVEDREIFLSINIGIAVYPSDGIDEDSFIKNGEFAMSNAKQQGQNTYQFF
ncbi:GGDEF domain-containing response regulator [Methylocucumis oryzae]|uniref:GGDEF domain-containing response regulator n=1 Tax=Methylocucumis oryzae TaxID=1632867 RepID=UPI000A97B1BE|nr:diguanylate cyclase [Methylocucumis oryzae]